MRRCPRFFSVAGLLLAGCASYVPAPFWNLHEADFDRLKPGVTRSEVLEQFGKPVIALHFPRQNQDVLEYRYLEASTVVKLADLVFDADGHLLYSFRYVDPAFSGGKGGH